MPAPLMRSMPASAPTSADIALSMPGLGVDDLGVGRREVAVGRQPERATDLRVGGVDHRRLDRAHRGRAAAHVEDRRRTAPDDRRAGAGELVDDDAAQGLGGVLDDGSDEGDRRRGAGDRHRDELGRHARPGEVDEVLAAEVGPGERGRRADVEHRARPGGQRLGATGVDRQQLDHRVDRAGCGTPR